MQVSYIAGSLLHCKQILNQLSHQGSLMSVDWQAQILVITSRRWIREGEARFGSDLEVH